MLSAFGSTLQIHDKLLTLIAIISETCWGLDLRAKPSPSEMLPNLFAGLQRNGAKRTRKYRMNAERRKLEDHDLRSEGYHLPKAEGNG